MTIKLSIRMERERYEKKINWNWASQWWAIEIDNLEGRTRAVRINAIKINRKKKMNKLGQVKAGDEHKAVRTPNLSIKCTLVRRTSSSLQLLQWRISIKMSFLLPLSTLLDVKMYWSTVAKFDGKAFGYLPCRFYSVNSKRQSSQHTFRANAHQFWPVKWPNQQFRF